LIDVLKDSATWILGNLWWTKFEFKFKFYLFWILL